MNVYRCQGRALCWKKSACNAIAALECDLTNSTNGHRYFRLDRRYLRDYFVIELFATARADVTALGTL